MKSLLPIQRGIFFAIAIVMLGGCAVGPNFVRPEAPHTDRYTMEPQAYETTKADGHAQHFISSGAIKAPWWQFFKSPQLDSVVIQALANNPTLQASEASLREAQDNMRAGYGVFFPQIQADAAAGRERSSLAQQGSQAKGRIFNLVTLSGTISYALDIFGGARRTVESLRAQADYQRYETAGAYLILSANVVNTTIARAAYTDEIHTTNELIELQKRQLDLTKIQARAGTASYSNVLGVESAMAATQASLAPLKQNADQAGDLLATLGGVEPSMANLPDIDLNKLVLPVDLPISLPSELVRQRPDILAAEAQMHADSAKIGVATALMFPSFSLNGTFGTSGSNFTTLTAASGKFWSIGPSATIPLFQGTTLWFGRRAAIDAYRQSQANYRQTVLSALAQVADSLKALEHDADALQAQVNAKQAAGKTLMLLKVNYRAGLVSYLDVLNADVQYHQATIAYLQAVAQRYQDTVALFTALGGGWSNEV